MEALFWVVFFVCKKKNILFYSKFEIKSSGENLRL
jgi:hypothetical protein